MNRMLTALSLISLFAAAPAFAKSHVAKPVVADKAEGTGDAKPAADAKPAEGTKTKKTTKKTKKAEKTEAAPEAAPAK